MKKGAKIKHKDDIGFENRLILNTCLIIAIGALLISVMNVLMGLDKRLTYISSAAVIAFSLFFLIGNYYNRIEFIRWWILIFAMVYINFAWYFNYVSNGPVLALFILYYCFLILIAEKNQFIVFSIVTIINLIVLFFIELKYHEVLPNYHDTRTRIIDVYAVTFLALVIAFGFLYYTKANYIKQYLKAKRTDELKSSFLANMSHEIRTPLNAIVGFSSLLVQKDYTDKKKEKYKSFIESNSKYLLHLVNDILDISKIESNQLSLIVEEFEVINLFEQLLEEYTNVLEKVGKGHVKISFQVHDNNLKLNTDRFRFEQILRNFLTNATKFTENGYIKYGCYLDEKDYVFYVEDTGTGIPEEDLELIFLRFTKLNKKNDSIHRGAGLGLFLTKQLVFLLGGKIWVKSKPDKGSTFYFSLPFSKHETANF